ncbi:MAG: hypothetical protein HKN90_05405 [Flavobacteriaceae bacterium]|nr:hypothetical protein [Flavobacteriaceae bacterium]
MKIKNLLFALMGLFFVIISCSDDDDGGSSFDAAAQALIDDEKLIEYLQSHHYIPPEAGEVFGVIDTLTAEETASPIFNDIEIKEITENDINYKLYYLVNNAGKNSNPSITDSILVNYRGFLLDSTRFDERLTYTWLPLTNVIRGWQFGFELFKDGDNTTPPNEPLQFSDTGNGILFLPSGLAYGNGGTVSIGPNEPLLFFINLGLVERADHDGDTLLSIYEDVDSSKNVNDDNTDNDQLPDYLDVDDDGDGVLTRDELVQTVYVISFTDEEPVLGANEFEYYRIRDEQAETITIYTTTVVDSNNDGTPDYLDPNTN